MKTEFKSVQVIPYGLPKGRLESFHLNGIHISNTWKRPGHGERSHAVNLLVTYSHLMDDVFVRAFHEKATPNTRLLVLNDRPDADRLASRLIDLQIRSPHRFYIAEVKWAAGKRKNWDVFLQSLLGRLTSAHRIKEGNRRILDATVENDILRTISADFTRLEIPISEIPHLAKAKKTAVQSFEIDEDGSYIYWTDLDLHLGWEQLQQIVDPVSVHKAKQKNREFNIRYGAAIRKLREQRGLAISAIPHISEKQLRRIERGTCRLTSNAATKLAEAHGLELNEYLHGLTKVLEKPGINQGRPD